MEEFSPTKAMKECKAGLHKRHAFNVIKDMEITDADIAKVLAPTPIPLVKRWMRDNPDFWTWLKTPQDCSVVLYDAREKCYAFLCELFEMDIIGDDGKADSAILKAKLDAAKLLIGQSPQMVINNNNDNRKAELKLPKHLKSGGTPALEEKVKQLNMTQDDDIEGELI